MTEEERHDQGSDMRTVDIGIGHDDHFMITNLREVQRFWIFFRTESDTECREDITYLFTLEHFMLHRFLYVEDLTAQRQNSLMHTVTTGLSRTACGITLYEEELALRCIFGHAVRQFTGQTTTGER